MRSTVRLHQEAFSRRSHYVGSHCMILETTESSLTDAPLEASIEDYMFVERIEQVLCLWTENPHGVPDKLDILNEGVVDRMWYARSRRKLPADDISTEHRLCVGTTLSSAKLCVSWWGVKL